MEAEFSINTLNPEMSTEEIFCAWSEITSAIETLKEACSNQLDALGFDEETYDPDNSTDEIQQVLDVWNILENIQY